MRKFMLAIAAVTLSMAQGLLQPARSQEFPSRPITLVVPYGPGSGVDILAREIAQKLPAILKVPVVVENKAGATGDIGTEFVAQAKPDGYTLLLSSNSGVINQIVSKTRSDLSRDFAPVAFAATLPYVVAVPPSLEAKTLAELMALARANPGKLNYNGPVGSVSDYLGATLKSAAGAEMVMIPYKTTSDAQVDLLSGRIQIWFTTATSALALAQSGKIRALAVTSDERMAKLPDVPTVREAGVPAMHMDVTFFFLAPAGTPPDIVQKLNRAFAQALGSKDLQDRLATQALAVKIGSSQEVKAHVADELAKWAKILGGDAAK